MRKFVTTSQLNQTHEIFSLGTTINLKERKKKKATWPETESETVGLDSPKIRMREKLRSQSILLVL